MEGRGRRRRRMGRRGVEGRGRRMRMGRKEEGERERKREGRRGMRNGIREGKRNGIREGRRKIRRGEEAYMEIMMSLPLTQYPPRNQTTYLRLVRL